MKTLLVIILVYPSLVLALSVDALRVVPNQIKAGETTRVMFSLDQASTISLEIKSLSGHVLTTLVSAVQYPAGQFSVAWKTPANIKSDYFTPVVKARDAQGNSVSEQIPLNTAKMMPLKFESKIIPAGGKTITYKVDKPGLVSIRVGINNGPLYKTILNWEFSAPGSHSVNWDGWDNCRVLRVDKLANYHIDVRYIPVDSKSLYIEGSQSTTPIRCSAPDTLAKIYAFVPEFAVKSDLRSNTVQLTLTVAPEKLAKLDDIPYEYVLYIDGLRYGEIEDVGSPQKWEIPTDAITKGEHIFTVMICTSIEQINSQSFKIKL